MRWANLFANLVLLGFSALFIGLSFASLTGHWNETFDLINHFIWVILITLMGLSFFSYLLLRETALRWARRGFQLFALLSLMSISSLTLASWLIPSSGYAPQGSTSESFTIATHNLWGRNLTPERAVDVLIATGADIIAMQESFGRSGRVPDQLSEAYRYRANCHRHAVALVSKYPMEDSGCLERTLQGDYPPPAAWADIRLPSGDLIRVLTVHMTWPEPLKDQGQQRRALAANLEGFEHDRLIVVGDFNAAAPSFALRRLERVINLPRRTHNIPTWPSHRVGRLGEDKTWSVLRPVAGIDHVFAGRDFVTLDVHAGDDTGSDHRPIIATLGMKAD
ncbi:endonuclease/exonuclease/phosphatase family protein [Woodsholea maritima]|uniref:endonuclease/exonuclease/phosphatase family protein n=1 Tax=Woodsholea maritima TaxID=240237 RepID=UPI000381D173|nr:endonuclease/exonuclease/phosphatase family protein [Woodsholea maritima]